MSEEEILVLTRLAQRFPEHRDALLPIIETVITKNGSGGAVSKPSDRKSEVTFPLDIFKVYQGKRHVALLHDTGAVDLNGETYYSPSAAAAFITDYAVNGWRWWRFRDPGSGQIREINDLRPLIG